MSHLQKRRRYLVIVHEANRSGAPLVCLYFLRWLQRQRGCVIDTVLLRGGSLEAEFAKVGSVRTLPWYIGKHWRMPVGLRWLLPKGRQRLLWLLRSFGLRFSVQKHLQTQEYDCVICNSIASIWCLKDIVPRGSPILLWAHELEYAITCLSFPPAMLRLALQSVHRVVACAKSVRDNLVENHGIPSEIVDVTTEFIEEESVTLENRSLRSMLIPEIPSDAFIVTCVAWIQYRKGPDLFLRMAHHLPREIDGKPVHFVWVGAETVPGMIDELLLRSESLGLRGRMHFLGEKQNPTTIVSVSDVFVLPSREDPYPLVMIEAGLASCPIVAFQGTGGAEEFLANGVGVLVPYGDVIAMAQAVKWLLSHPEEARSHREKVRASALLHTVERVAPTIDASCERLLKE